MLKTRFVKLLTIKLDDSRYLLAAEDEHGHGLPPSEWKNVLFSRHDESFLAHFWRTSQLMASRVWW